MLKVGWTAAGRLVPPDLLMPTTLKKSVIFFCPGVKGSGKPQARKDLLERLKLKGPGSYKPRS